MYAALPDHISFCIAGDRPVFLDINADRYFCLSDEAESAFLSLIQSEGLIPAPDRPVSQMLKSGMLIKAETPGLITPCINLASPSSSIPNNSIPEYDIGPGSFREGCPAFYHIMRARIHLRFAGFGSTLRALARKKADISLLPPDVDREGRLASILSGFRCISTLLDSQDRCLPNSIALASAMIAHRLSADLILGVRLAPFSAHAWVLHEGQLVNDSQEHIRTFTPIRAI